MELKNYREEKMALFDRRGQVMILATLAIGGTFLGATVIASLLTTYQIRQARNGLLSSQALLAATMGVEYGLYEYFGQFSSPPPLPPLEAIAPNTTTTKKCYWIFPTDEVPCAHPSTTVIRATGQVGTTVFRSFEFTIN